MSLHINSNTFSQFKPSVNNFTATKHNNNFSKPGSKKKKLDTKYSLAVLSGWLSYKAAPGFLRKIFMMPVSRKLLNQPEVIEEKTVKKIAEKMVKSSGLDKKNFEYHFINYNNLEYFEKRFEDKTRKALENYYTKFEKFFGESSMFNPACKAARQARRITNKLGPQIYRVMRGENAFFYPLNKMAVTSKKRTSWILHEIGHSISNSKNKKLGLLKFIPIVGLPLTVLIGLITRDKEDNQNSVLHKTGKFVKNNAPVIAFLCLVPRLCEEARASKFALHYSKDMLDSTKYNALKKSLSYAFSTYVIFSIITAVAVKFGIYVKDKLTETDKK